MSKFNLTADKVLGPFAVPNDPHRNTPLTLFATGTFGSGTLKAQISPDGQVANAMDLTGVSLTANGFKALPLINGQIFIVLSGSTSPNLNVWLQ